MTGWGGGLPQSVPARDETGAALGRYTAAQLAAHDNYAADMTAALSAFRAAERAAKAAYLAAERAAKDAYLAAERAAIARRGQALADALAAVPGLKRPVGGA